MGVEDRIILPDSPEYPALSKAARDPGGYKWFPPIQRDRSQEHPYAGDDWMALQLKTVESKLGMDLEFHSRTGRPSILGIASPTSCGAAPWDLKLVEQMVDEAERGRYTLIGHSVMGADRPVVEQALGRRTPRRIWGDSMIRHYLCNAELCSAPGKDEDDDDQGAMGFMDLWSAATMCLTVPNHKACRGSECSGPCPKHDVFGYCSIDAWEGLMVEAYNERLMEQRRIPEQLYQDMLELAEICQIMQVRGLCVDRAFVEELETKADEKKMELFPYEERHKVGKKGQQLKGLEKIWKFFNPKSPKQVLDWGADQGWNLKKTDKDAIKTLLLKEAKKECGLLDLEEIAAAEKLPENLDILYRLYEYKMAGKGLKSWFDERYFGLDGLLHPRTIMTGTSTSRLASSKPNYQNILARGWGALARKAFKPHDESLEFVSADASNLELRTCLYCAGTDPQVCGADAFKWLISNAPEFEAAYQDTRYESARDLAKSVSHAADYLEGFRLYDYEDLDTETVRRQVNAGALAVYHPKFKSELKKPWEYCGKVVAFTGINLAERFFGQATFENRKKALAIQEDIYFKRFNQLRQWHMQVLAGIEARGYVQLATGHRLELVGTPEENAKTGVATLGQGTGAGYITGVMIQYARRGHIPIMQIHDELVFECPKSWTDDEVRDFLRPMGEEHWRLPGFSSPYKGFRGSVWLKDELKRVV